MSVFDLTKENHVATLWLDNPDRHNAMGLDFFLELPQKVEEVDKDPDIRVLIVAARGKNFSVGLDLKGGMGEEFMKLLSGGLADQRQRLYKEIKRVQTGFSAIYCLNKPVIAAVSGWCVGGGLDLISACDLRYGDESANLSLRETKMAMVQVLL